MKYEQYISINDKVLGLNDKFVPPILHDNHTIRYVKHLIHQNELPESILEDMKQAGIKEIKPQDLEEFKKQFFTK